MFYLLHVSNYIFIMYYIFLNKYSNNFINVTNVYVVNVG